MGRKISEVTLAKAVSSALGEEVQPIGDLGSIWIYRQGFWHAPQREHLHQVVIRTDPDLGDRERESVLRTLYRLRYKIDFFAKAKPVIVFSDCTVEVSAEGLRARSHNPDDRARHALPFPCPFKIPVEFGPTLKPELGIVKGALYLRMIEAAGDAVLLLEQFLGATLLGIAPRFKKALILQGKPNSGKSQWIELFRQLVAPPQMGALASSWVSSLFPEELGERFGSYQLVRSRLNLVDDADDATLKTGRLKSAISGGVINAEQKHGPSFVFSPLCAWLIATNHAPRVDEFGLIERFNLLRFTRRYDFGSTAIPELGRRAAEEEGPYIVARALLGAVKLLQDGNYTLPASSVEAAEEWRKEADWTRIWKADRCIPLDHPEATGHQLYVDAMEWATSRGYRPMTETSFGRKLKEHTKSAPSDRVRYHLRLAPKSPDSVEF